MVKNTEWYNLGCSINFYKTKIISQIISYRRKKQYLRFESTLANKRHTVTNNSFKNIFDFSNSQVIYSITNISTLSRNETKIVIEKNKLQHLYENRNYLSLSIMIKELIFLNWMIYLYVIVLQFFRFIALSWICW